MTDEVLDSVEPRSRVKRPRPLLTLRPPRPPGRGERAVELLLAICAAITVLTTVTIVGALLWETWAFFRVVSPTRFFGDTAWTPLYANPRFGIWPLLAGTLQCTLIALTVAVPAGVLAALYSAEFASPALRRWLKPALEVVAGVPTIVFGYFALVAVTPWLQRWVPGLSGFNALSAGLVLGIMLVPTVSSLSEDALSAVPQGLREASLALGADRLTTVLRVVLPSAARGIGAAVMLATSRALGETMIVSIAGGHRPHLGLDPRVPIETMTSYMVQLTTGEVAAGSFAQHALFAVATVLFLSTLVTNAASHRLRRAPRSAR